MGTNDLDFDLIVGEKFQTMKIVAALICSSVLMGGLWACQVPVFRYALERWPADEFRLLVASRGPLEAELQRELDDLRMALAGDPPPLNLKLEVVDLATATEDVRLSHPGLEHAGEGSSMVLMPPESWQVDEPAWVGEASVENLGKLRDSPLRRRCASLLLSGESAVWIIVESGDAEKDTQARAQLAAGLDQAAATIELPVGVVRREDLNEGFDRIDPDNILRSDVPLKIGFAIETVGRQEAEEAVFLPTLVEPEALALDEPLIVPVFGRGRTFGGMPASQSSVERIVAACEYLCGACSCQVKEGNPGYDLLFETNWDGVLHGEETGVESEAVQQALEVVSFSPADKPSAGAEPSAKLGSAMAVGAGITAIVLGAISLLALARMPARS